MRFTRLILAAAFTLTAAVAQASVVSNVSGDVCEGGVEPATSSPCPAKFNLGDFDTDASDPTLRIVGDTRIWGGVAHRNTDKNQFFDNFSLDLGTQAYTGTFNWQVKYRGWRPDFDGRIVVGGTLENGDVVGGTAYTFTSDAPNGVFEGTVDLGTLTGDGITVIIDPIFGIFTDDTDEIATWDLELTQVPLPASALMLLAGIGGLAALRRRNRAS